MFICNLHCQLFLRISGNMLHKKHVPMQNFPLYLKKAGLASRNVVHVQKTFYVVSISAFIFFILFVKPVRSLLIQRIRAGYHRSGCLLLKHSIQNSINLGANNARMKNRTDLNLGKVVYV